MKKILGALAVVAMITLMAPAPAQAQAVGNVNVSIDVSGGILILYYYSDLTVQMDIAAVFGTPAGCTLDSAGHLDCENATAQTQAATYTGAPPTAATADFNLTPGAIGTPAALPLTLANVWAVRSAGGATASSSVAISNTAATFAFGGSSIAASGWVVDSPNNAGAAAASITFPDPGLGTPEVGDVIVTLDFSGYTTAGLHVSAGTDYTLTATNL